MRVLSKSFFYILLTLDIAIFSVIIYLDKNVSDEYKIKKGDNVKIIGELIHPIAMDEGLKLAIREGGRTIASGQVTKIIE